MNEPICKDPQFMAYSLVRCACREACRGCQYEAYAKMCDDLRINDTCVDRMMREAAVLLYPNTEETIDNLMYRDFDERRRDGETKPGSADE